MIITHSYHRVDRIINLFFIYAFFIVLAFYTTKELYVYFYWGIALSLIFSMLCFLIYKLALDALWACFWICLITFSLGQWVMGICLLYFFLCSLFLNSIKVNINTKNIIYHKRRHSSMQIWSNGVWICFFTILSSILKDNVYLFIAFIALNTAVTNTIATQVGIRWAKKAVSILNFRNVDIGDDGGISWQGTLASFFGAMVIPSIIWASNLEAQLNMLILIGSAGFIGNLIDSVIGSIIYKSKKSYDQEKNDNITNITSIGIISLISGIILFTLI